MKFINKLIATVIIWGLLFCAVALAGDSKNVDIIKKLDAACNSHNLDAALALFADNGMVKLLPPPPDGGVYTGKEQIGNWMKTLLAGFHVESANFRTDGNQVMWDFTVHSDMFAQMGVNPVRGTVTAVIKMEKIKSFMPVFDQETVSKLTIPGVNNHVVRPN